MKPFDPETRRRLATGWDPRVCSARDYARSVGVSERALRLWRAQLAGDERPVMPARHWAVPQPEVLDGLQARLADLDVALDAVRAVLAACRACVDAAAACRSTPETGGIDNPLGEPLVTVDDASGMPHSAPGDVETSPTAHCERRDFGAGTGEPQHTPFVDAAVPVQADAVPISDVAQPETEEEQVRVRPAPWNSWASGCGFLGPF
jgi:hypothetical protein